MKGGKKRRFESLLLILVLVICLMVGDIADVDLDIGRLFTRQLIPIHLS